MTAAATPLPARRLPAPDQASPKAKQHGWSPSNPCVLCGRQIKDSAALMVEMNTSWEVVDHRVEHEDSQGCFPIGAGCARKHKWLTPYTFNRNEQEA